MGTWGTGLYQDDITCEVQEDYIDRLKIGMSNDQATYDLEKYYGEFTDDEDVGLFYIALADTQWMCGRLSEKIKKKAIDYIKSGDDAERWDSHPQQVEREKVLHQLEEKLNSPQPPEKIIKRMSLKKAPWKSGDILNYKLHNERLRDTEWYNKCVLLKVIGISKTNIGSLPRHYYNEYNVVEVCGIIDEYNKIKAIKNDSKIILDFTNREVKKSNIQLYEESKSLDENKEKIVNYERLPWVNIDNIDLVIFRILNQSKK